MISCVTTTLIIFYLAGLAFQQTVDDHVGDNPEESTSLGMTDTLKEPAKVGKPHHGDGNKEVSQCRADFSRDRLLACSFASFEYSVSQGATLLYDFLILLHRSFRRLWMSPL